jgi:hypothetical protein
MPVILYTSNIVMPYQNTAMASTSTTQFPLREPYSTTPIFCSLQQIKINGGSQRLITDWPAGRSLLGCILSSSTVIRNRRGQWCREGGGSDECNTISSSARTLPPVISFPITIRYEVFTDQRNKYQVLIAGLLNIRSSIAVPIIQENRKKVKRRIVPARLILLWLYTM